MTPTIRPSLIVSKRRAAFAPRLAFLLKIVSNTSFIVLAAFIRKQGRKAGRLMIDDSNSRLLASKSGDKALDEELYIEKIEALTTAAGGQGYLMEKLGTYISYICNAAAQHHIMMNPSFVSAALAVKVEEGIALALDPACQIWKAATPVIVESERRRHVANVRQRLGMGGSTT